MGPGTTLRGASDADPRVSGRIRDLAVSDDGTRIYAGTAGGGVWYSGDSGLTWLPVGAYTLGGDVTTDAPSSTTLAIGALYVRFGASADEDEVWAGTGESYPDRTPQDFGNLGDYGGIGILHATGPVHTVLQDPDTDPWEHGAPALRGQGVYAFAAHPADPADPAAPSTVIAGTSAGLHSFNPAAGPLTEPWSLVTVAAWEAALGVGGSGRVHVTDLAWVSTPAGPRLWVAVSGDATDAAVRGLWRSDKGLDGPFIPVGLTGVATDAQRGTLLNLGLAAAPSDPTVLYVLSTGPRLWRVDGDTTVRRVLGLPVHLFDTQGEYDLAVAVDPGQPLRVVVGGAATDSSLTLDTGAAALFRLTLRTPAPVGNASWHTDYAGNEGSDATWIGEGVHADVHRLRWLPTVAGGRTRLHVACDGGLFVSAADGDPTTFTARNTGLGSAEAGYLDSHPVSDGPVLIGVNDNGILLRIGESVWRRVTTNGDGGGVAFDPSGSGRFIGQAHGGSWRDDAGTLIKPSFRGLNEAPETAEDRATRFYSNAAVISVGGVRVDGVRVGGVTQLALGTSRVWYSEQWFRTFRDATFAIRVQAVTLPSATDPRAGDANDSHTDVLDAGPLPPDTQDARTTGVRALRWAGPDRLYALMPGAVHRLDRTPGTANWHRTRIMRRAVAAGGVAPAVSGPVIPPEGILNDLAVHDPAALPDGSFYVATSNPLEPLWWFDGTGVWYPSGLGTLPPDGPGVRVPAYSVTVDTVDPPEPGVVYVGTEVGVWRGALTITAGVPAWDWAALANGLPEAAVQDLSVVRYPLAQGGHVRLLRAALQSRGVWECQLDTDLVDVTYLRVHPYDTRRSLPTALPDPLPPSHGADREWHLDWADVRARAFSNAGRPAPSPDGTQPGSFTWHASPDVRVRPVLGSPAFPAPLSLPWTRKPADRYALWALQTALHAFDPLIVPDGRWTALFGRRLSALRQDIGLVDHRAVVDAALWIHPAIAAGWWANPWDGLAPSEADLAERIVHRTTARPTVGAQPEVEAPTVSAASCAVPAGPLAVEVCVHRRALQPLGRDGLTVLLLRTQLDPNAANWAGMPALAVAGLGDAMASVPADGGPLGIAPPAGWQFADSKVQVRRPALPAGPDAPPVLVGPAAPVVMSFQTDLTGQAGQWLLLAVIAAGAGTPSLAGASLRDQVLGSPHLAARSAEIR
jgi:hypothetical protein